MRTSRPNWVAEKKLRQVIAAEQALNDWQVGRTHRVARGFYTSQALEMVHR